MTSRLDRLSQVNAATIAEAEGKARRLLRDAMATDGPGAAKELAAKVAERLSVLAGQAGDAAWAEAVAVELRRLHIAEYAFGKGGFELLTPEDRSIIEARLQQELEFLRGFTADLPNLSEAEIQARLAQYVKHGNASFWDGQTALHAEIGHTEMRRELNPAEHCEDCVVLSAMGFRPIGELPMPGDGSQCMANCACTCEYR